MHLPLVRRRWPYRDGHGVRPFSTVFVLLLVAAAGCNGSSRPAGSPTTPGSTSSSTTAGTVTHPSGQATTTLERIAFFDSHDGYGLFEQRSADDSSCKHIVAKTTDGVHFARLESVDSWSCGDSPDASYIAFDDHGDGFVYGPKLFASHDGGLHWTQAPQPAVVTAVAALGYSIWMLEGKCPPGQSDPGNVCALQLFESSDGGRSWTPSPSPLPNTTVTSGALALEPALGQSWLVRASPSAAYVVSSPMPSQSGAPDSVPLWYTSDSGRSWAQHEIPCGLAALSVAVSLAPDGTLTGVCAGEPGAGAQPKSTAVSHDGGRTWTIHSCPGGAGPSSYCLNNNPLDFGYLGAIDAVTANTTYLVGGRSPLLVTIDGGTNWKQVQPLIGGSDAGTDQVIFFNEHDGIVLGTDSGSEQTTLWITSDGGNHWSKVIPTLD